VTLQIGPTIYIFAVAISLFLFGLAQIVRIVGPRILLNIVVGRYQRPVQEERIFMFLDLEGSTALAEKMGDLGVQKLINQFFFDITDPILEWGGEIHRYVGDQIVVTWPMSKGLDGANCLNCCLAIRRRIVREAPHYQAAFDHVPGFRIGLHGGHVVASQCGDVKQEIVYFGDTINAAARIEQYCKQAGRKLLISQDLAARLPDQASWNFESVGSVQLRGRTAEMSLLAVAGQP
jgi:adenylate cyclase